MIYTNKVLNILLIPFMVIRILLRERSERCLSIPISPPLSAIALRTLSGFKLFIFQSALAPICAANIGFLLTSTTSRAV